MNKAFSMFRTTIKMLALSIVLIFCVSLICTYLAYLVFAIRFNFCHGLTASILVFFFRHKGMPRHCLVNNNITMTKGMFALHALRTLYSRKKTFCVVENRCLHCVEPIFVNLPQFTKSGLRESLNRRFWYFSFTFLDILVWYRAFLFL